MSKPPPEFLPWRAPFIPCSLCQQKAILLVLLKQVIELLSRAGIHNDSIGLHVPTQTARVEVSTSHRTALPVYKNNLSVVKAGRVHPHLASLFHELVGIVKSTIGCEGNIASR